jgi:hypothetical protein
MIITDLMVLTINALEIAVEKEDVADPLLPANYRLFSTVNTDGGDIKRGITPAISKSA